MFKIFHKHIRIDGANSEKSMQGNQIRKKWYAFNTNLHMVSFVFRKDGESVASVDYIIECDHSISLRFIDWFVPGCWTRLAATTPRLQRNDPSPNRIRSVVRDFEARYLKQTGYYFTAKCSLCIEFENVEQILPS